MRMIILVAHTVFSIVLLVVSLHTSTQAAPIEFATEVFADGPIGYWRLGESHGSASAADSSGRGNNGTYSSSGITLGQPGFHGGDTAALFDGATGRIVVPNSATLNPPQITMEAKVRWDGPNGLQQRILEKESFAGTTQYGLSILPDGRVQVELRKKVSGAPIGVIANSIGVDGVVAVGVETHVVATYDGVNFISIYINGNLNSTTAVGAFDIDTKAEDDPSVALAIGDRMGAIPPPPLHRTFNGLIDEVALYAKALSAERIHNHYQSQFAKQVIFQYAVKFVCGKSEGRVVALGTYFTAINVHNPNERRLGFKKKFAVALPGEQPGPISKFSDSKLGPDQAFEIDCPDIFRRTGTKGRFLKGFVVIESVLELDVVVVYTAAGATGRVETMELERVKPRRQGAEGKPDLIPAS